jgi:lysozyme family protein
MSEFAVALPIILAHEGGLVDNPADPGGVTDFGISLRFLQEHGLDLNGDGDVDGDDIRGLTHDQAGDIYRHYFWDANDYSRIADQTLATKVFDVCVNSGPHQAHTLVQRALCAVGQIVTVDGALGAKSFAAIAAADAAKLTQAICDAQADFYRNLAKQKPQLAQFLSGWLKRAAWPNRIAR